MKSALLAFSLCLLAPAAFADAPFQFAAPGVRAPDDPHVSGMRLAFFHGENQRVRGVDFGILSLSETADLSGFSAILGMGRVSRSTSGLASGLINIHTGTDRGVNAAFVNRVNKLASGANIGFINITDDYTMVDVGGVNVSDRTTVQVGFLNVTRRLESVQIGFLNIAENGFLPMFPIFNFPKSTSRKSGSGQ
jgi:hypothetical protein